jgi:hypothetical protein
VSLANNRSQPNNQLTKRIENKMTITYSLWQGSNLLSVDNTAKNSAELLAVMAELEKLGKGFTYNVRKVEVKN